MTLLAVARIEVASKWKSNTALSLFSWRNKLWDRYFMAKVTNAVHLNGGESNLFKFEEI